MKFKPGDLIQQKNYYKDNASAPVYEPYTRRVYLVLALEGRTLTPDEYWVTLLTQEGRIITNTILPKDTFELFLP